MYFNKITNMSLPFPYNSEINFYKYENNYINTKIYIYMII